MKQSSFKIWCLSLTASITFNLHGCYNHSASNAGQLNNASSRSSSADCIDQAIEVLGIDMNMQTDPDLLQSIATEDMYLEGLTATERIYGRALHEKQSLWPMLEQIRASLKAKHPAINEFLCEALDNNLITRDQVDEAIVTRFIHHTFLLEAMTQAMRNDAGIMSEVVDHYMKKREKFGIRSDFVGTLTDLAGITGQMFIPVKIISVDWILREWDRLRSDGFVASSELTTRQKSLELNILEASVTAKEVGDMNNAITGAALAANSFKSVKVSGENRVIEYEYSQDWTSLYETWNMSFVTGHLPYTQIFLPKLLIPSVIGAESNDYIFNRGLSLWVTLNFQLFAQLSQKPSHAIPNTDTLTAIWAGINAKYADDYTQRVNGKKLTELQGVLDITLEDITNAVKNSLLKSGELTAEQSKELTELFAKYNDR